MPPIPDPARPSPFAGGGTAGAEIAAVTWHDHPLGDPAHWPPQLVSMLATVLASPQPMFLAWGADLHFFFNDGYRPLLGARADGAQGRRFRDLWAAEWPDLEPVVARAIVGEGVKYEEWPLRVMRNGYAEDTWWTYSYMPLLDAVGAVVGMWCVTNEATAQVLGRAAAAAERRRQQRLVEQMPGFVAVLTGPDHVYDYVNDAYRAISGERDFVGHSVREVFPELEGQGFYELLDRVYATGERYVATGLPISLRGDAAERYVDLLYEPIVDDDGTVTGIFVGGYDATEAYRTLAALGESEERLRLLTATLEARVEERTQALKDSMDFTRLALSAVGGVGVWTFDVASDRFTCDANIARLYDIDPVEAAAGIARTRFLANVHDDDRASLAVTMQGGLVNPGDLELEYRIVHRDGSVRWVLSRGHSYFDENGRPVRRTGVGVDMTRQREMEEQLRQAQKMEAVGQLTGGIAHDFNNLLQGITGSLEVVQRRIGRGQYDSLERFIDGATTAANRAAALTHRLLAFSRRQPLDPKPVHANNLVASMEELFRRTIGEQVELRLALATGLWTTRCDPNQLENAILNLVINARDAMPDGGVLTIETANAQIDDGFAARQHGVTPGAYVCLSVSDTGTGMSADTIAKAFEPFFTTKPIGQGTGLGLSMIYGFARQSEGHARIISELGQGTIFKLYLPRHGGEAEEDAPAAGPGELPATDKGEVVLVVEDEGIVRSLIVEELAELGYDAVEAIDGPAGLAILQSDRRIDLLITDIGLPGLNGRQLADAARERRPDLKILFMTGYAENAALASGFLEPGMAMITKPFAMAALATRIRAIIEGEREPGEASTLSAKAASS
jgi:signal transduction histidine kinase/ActR/RegA family two-component response regulator